MAKNLKQILDEIDRKTIQNAIGPFSDALILEKRGMWLKGWAIIEAYPEAAEYEGDNVGGRPEKTCKSLTGFSWARLERYVCRPRQSLKSWVGLAKHIGQGEEKFEVWAKAELPRIKERFQKKFLPPPETPALPAGDFDVWLADPPWPYDFSKSESRAIRQKYPTMTIEQIKALNLPRTENAVLFLWGTPPKLREALEVMEAWGFQYKTHAVWDKEIIGMGYWFRGQHEVLLVGVKGKGIPPEAGERVSSIIRERRTDIHSRKPERVYEIIENMFPNQKKIELFQTKLRNGWVGWGNQIA